MPCSNINLAHPTLPDSVVSEDGNSYPINPDFRVVLGCLERLGDPDKKDLEKAFYLAHHFFLQKTLPDMGDLFSRFVSGGKTEHSGGGDEQPLMDFAQDGGVIYASFRQQYSINLLKDSLHWYEFQELLAGLSPETPLGKRIHLRGLDISTIPEKDRGKWQIMKEQVAVVPKMSTEEKELHDELDHRLAAGEDPAEIITVLNTM